MKTNSHQSHPYRERVSGQNLEISSYKIPKSYQYSEGSQEIGAGAGMEAEAEAEAEVGDETPR